MTLGWHKQRRIEAAAFRRPTAARNERTIDDEIACLERQVAALRKGGPAHAQATRELNRAMARRAVKKALNDE